MKGGTDYLLDDTEARDRFQQFAAMAREPLSDFREVEYNFRALDRKIRKDIALSAGGKGEALAEIFVGAGQIKESGQGRSFSAFMELLLAPRRREEFGSMLKKAFEIKAIAESGYDRSLMNIYNAWFVAGGHAARRMA